MSKKAQNVKVYLRKEVYEVLASISKKSAQPISRIIASCLSEPQTIEMLKAIDKSLDFAEALVKALKEANTNG